MRYLKYKLDLERDEYSVLTRPVTQWSGDDPWARLGLEPCEQKLVIENADRIPWAEWKPIILVRQYENDNCHGNLFSPEYAEVEEHAMEILRGTYPGYTLVGFDAGFQSLELHYLKDGSAFYFTAILDAEEGCAFDLSFTGPKTVDNIRPSYRVCYTDDGPMQITEKHGSTARILQMVLRDSENDDWVGNLCAEVEEFADI